MDTLLKRVRSVRRFGTMLLAVATAFAAVLLARDPAVLWWSVSQLSASILPWSLERTHGWEEWAWKRWETPARMEPKQPLEVPVLAVGEKPASLTTPFIVRGLLNGSRAIEGFGGPEWLLQPPVAEIEVDYFTDASAKTAVVPNGRGRLGEIVAAILDGGPQKLGTQMIFERFPELLAKLGVIDLLAPLFGGENFHTEWLGSTLTVPVFVGRGAVEGQPIRTDLHCEPIGNAMLMLNGRKRWTLVPPGQSHLLKPTVSPDGRAYFLSALPNGHPGEFAAHAERYEVETVEGDVLWVPTWTWHRVDYLPGIASVSASLFHVRVDQIVTHNPLFAALLLPNLFKELIGWKTQ